MRPRSQPVACVNGTLIAASAVLINAVKEQQTQIEQQQKQLQQQQAVIEGLRQLVCGQNPQAEVCK